MGDDDVAYKRAVIVVDAPVPDTVNMPIPVVVAVEVAAIGGISLAPVRVAV